MQAYRILGGRTLIQMEPLVTLSMFWFLTEEGETTQPIPHGQQSVEFFFFLLTGALNENFTILLFGRSLDRAHLECNNDLNPSNKAVAFFSLEIIG